ncbi:MAG: 3-hydroxyacyl-ACP dehydratase FabZ [Holosporales bacterium]|jgi:3-hydroxyacyl-[acyl-carrier-protein] dehydratase|nr:3-hydroxyacyl-ACP dehydratase FabZ [Holosporales bacterium]
MKDLSDNKKFLENKEVLYLEDIKKIIPHRYPFLMIDRIEEFRSGKSCVACKNVSNNEWFFQGHFPNYPVMPGVLIIEAMAQAAGVLAFRTLIEEGVCEAGGSDFVYFTSIENARFKTPIVPGDVLRILISVEQRSGHKFWRFNGKVFVKETLADEADFKAMIPEKR